MVVRCDFQLSEEEPNIIVVIDLNRGNMSVTNDVENVIDELRDRYGSSLDEHRVIYQDSQGIWDGIRTQRGQFAGFIPLNTTSKQTAIATIKEIR